MIRKNTILKIFSICIILTLSCGCSFLRVDTGSYEPETSTSAANAILSYTETGDVFKRFSAYRNDKRITQNRGLKPGTYATTEEDATYIQTGTQAVNRYALPNDAPAVYVFTIRPPPDTPVKKGVVQPAYGRDGGGVEVLFVDGCQENTVSIPKVIPAD